MLQNTSGGFEPLPKIASLGLRHLLTASGSCGS